jgi:lipopolysaccharide transport system ATP-binding protein
LAFGLRLDFAASDQQGALAVTAVEVHHLSKNYPLSKSQFGRLRHLFGSGSHAPHDGLWALRDVTFMVARGEAFGIIGANGSGKSTLLQIVAGILRPTSGSVEVHGRLSALLELGAGFSPEFTGRDNVYLNGSLLGLSREEIDARFAAIERFAEIGDFIGQPIRTYSTGMVLRLAFAVSANVDPEILIVDEALAVGDIAFRQRCMRKIHELRAQGTTILFVSHETSDVKALCERCLWLHNGVPRELGEADDVVAAYLSASLHSEIQQSQIQQSQVQQSQVQQSQIRQTETERTSENAAPRFVPAFESVAGRTGASPSYDEFPVRHRYGDGRATIVVAGLIDGKGQSVRGVTPRDRLVLRIGFRANSPIASPIAGFLVRNSRGENIFGSNSARENYPLPPMSPGDHNNVEFHWSVPDLVPGVYRISLAVSDGNVEGFEVCDYMEDAMDLTAAANPGSSRMASRNGSKGYFQLHCAAVAVHRNRVVNKGGSVVS